MADLVSNLTDDELIEVFDETRGELTGTLSQRFGVPPDQALDVIHRALVRFLRDTPDWQLMARGQAEA